MGKALFVVCYLSFVLISYFRLAFLAWLVEVGSISLSLSLSLSPNVRMGWIGKALLVACYLSFVLISYFRLAFLAWLVEVGSISLSLSLSLSLFMSKCEDGMDRKSFVCCMFVTLVLC